MQAKKLVRKLGYDDISAVVIKVLPEWYFVREVVDFRFDSFSLISRYSVSRIRFNRFEKKLSEIFSGREDEAGAEPPITLEQKDDDKTIFEKIAALDRLTIVENEEPNEERFMIGNIHRATSNRLFMKHFLADGKWWARPSGINFWEISRVAFGGNYETAWQEYFRDQGDP